MKKQFKSYHTNNLNIPDMSCFYHKLSGCKTYLTAFIMVLFLSLSINTHAQEDIAAGEAIFKAKCTSCHAVDKKVVGPALVGVTSKYDREWLYSWIKNSQAMVKAGDPQAVAIFEEYNKSVMTAFNLTNAEIDNVLAYVDNYKGGEDDDKDEAAAKQSGFGPTAIFLTIVAILLLIIIFILSRLTGSLNSVLRERLGEWIPEAPSFEKKFLNKKVLAALSLGFLIFLGYTTADSAQKLGRQQDYAPTQPIKFSHELHAGVNKIECQYCHSGAAKGKSAVIPSANVCMNCHKYVAEGPKYGKKEIGKIYKAVGWDPDAGQYIEGYEQKPIEWIRIHNLPDHVYFNHSQHVNVGGLECQQCHGPVEEMEVMRQHSTLGMGWCINCHRETEVNFEGNDYYQAYEKYHEQLKNGEINKVTVEDIGGLECQKCHY